MKAYRFIFFTLLAGLVIFTSCKKELTNKNINPNNLEKPDAGSLLTNVIVSEFYNNAFIAWTLGNGYGQYMTFSQSYYNQPTRYYPVTNEPYWIAMYQAARDANTMVQLGQSSNKPLVQAAGLALRSYAFAQLTELWGDIPFLQSLQGSSGIYTPQYDLQKTVYTDPDMGILASLREADAIFKANPNGSIQGDILFSSSHAAWRRFINALRLRYLLRISAKMDVSAEMQAIVADGSIMQSASHSAILTLQSTVPYNFLSLTERSGDFAVKYMNSLMYNTLNITGDTSRMNTYFTTIAGTPTNAAFNFTNFGGMPLVTDATAAQTNGASNFNGSFRTGSNPALIKARIITYAEQEFILAEAALKGLIAGSPSTYYQSGVTGAYAEIGLSQTAANDYLAHDSVAYNGTLRQIITQKWIANINNGFEGWLEYLRTGYPALSPGGSVNLNGGNIATRFTYPISESTINSANYSKELQVMGGSDLTIYKSWWKVY